MLPGEPQVVRIHETGFDEALGLLRAPARIRCVDETALVVQKGVQIAPGARASFCRTFSRLVSSNSAPTPSALRKSRRKT
jgi:hypothetical protein